MYVSCLLVDVGTNPDRPRPGRLWLRQPYRIHQRLCMGFPSAERLNSDPGFLAPYRKEGFAAVHEKPRTREQSFLYRVDALQGGTAVILVQSAILPDWDYAFSNARELLAGPPQVKEFEPRFDAGDKLLFCLRANPTWRENDSHRRQGVFGKEKQREWLLRKAEAGGFVLLSANIKDESLRHAHRGHTGSDRQVMTHLAVRYDGVLQVTEPGAFADTLVRGVGSAKAFGFGLVSVAPYGGG